MKFHSPHFYCLKFGYLILVIGFGVKIKSGLGGIHLIHF